MGDELNHDGALNLLMDMLHICSTVPLQLLYQHIQLKNSSLCTRLLTTDVFLLQLLHGQDCSHPPPAVR